MVFRVDWGEGITNALIANSYVISLRKENRGDSSSEWKRYARDKLAPNKRELRAWRKRLNQRRMSPNEPGIRNPRAFFDVSD